MLSKGSCHIEICSLVHGNAGFPQHDLHHSMGCCFCTDKFLNIFLIKEKPRCIFHCQHSLFFLDPAVFLWNKISPDIHPAAKKHLSQQINDPGSTDPFRLPFSDHMTVDLSFFNMYPVHCTFGCTHACFYNTAFQSRSGCSCTT